MKYGILISAAMWAAVLSALFVMSGCTTSGGMKADVLGANIEIAKQRAIQRPVLDAEIPTPNGIMKIVVHAPNTSPTTVAMPDDGWARVADRAVGVLGTAAGLYLGGEAAVSLVRGTSAGIADALRVQPAPTVVNQPAPVVVQPAEPVIVEQPAPVIIEQPEPIIIEQPVIAP
jgi:hypothetical protein